MGHRTEPLTTGPSRSIISVHNTPISLTLFARPGTSAVGEAALTMLVETLTGNDLYLIHGFLTPRECSDLIRYSETLRYEEAPITTASGFVMAKEYRNNDRVMVDDRTLAANLWDKARPHLPPRWSDRYNVAMNVVGLNERFRFYRYAVGQKFSKHYDGAFRRDDADEISQLTFMIYLNGGFEGGETVFYDEDSYPTRVRHKIRPEQGKALVFRHAQLHAGAAVLQGVKYVLRTDVMYAYPRLVP